MAVMKTASVNVRIQEDVKKQAEAILEKLGLPRAVAIDLFYRQIIMNNGIPFALNVPNTPKSIDEISKEEFHQMMHTGLEQAKNGQSQDFNDVFKQLNQGL